MYEQVVNATINTTVWQVTHGIFETVEEARAHHGTKLTPIEWAEVKARVDEIEAAAAAK